MLLSIGLELKNLMTEITAAYTRGSLGVTNAAAAQATANGAQTLPKP